MQLQRQEWEVIRDGADLLLADLTSAQEWRMCEALLTVHAIADEACAGLAIAKAAEQEAAALRHADLFGLAHSPHPDARNMQLRHELRRGAHSRRGPRSSGSGSTRPSPSWARPWRVWALSAIWRAFAELAQIAFELSAEIERIDAEPAARRAS